MSSKNDDLNLQVGSTIYGRNGAAELAADIVAGTLRGAEMIGRIYESHDFDVANTSHSFIPKRSNVLRKLMPVRNVSGFAVLPKRLVKLQVSGLNAYKNVSGYARLDNDQYAYPVDEHLPAAGCPDQDVCYIVVEGPALCYLPLSQVGDIVDGQPMGALTAPTNSGTTAGRVFGIDGTATNLAASAGLNFLGWAMSAVSSSATGAEILVNVRRHH